MGLEREGPAGVDLDVVDAGVGVGAAEGLEGVDGGRGEHGGDGLGVAAGSEDEFQFVDARDCVGGRFGRACNPVDGVGQRERAVGLDVDTTAGAVKGVDQGGGELQGGLAASDDGQGAGWVDGYGGDDFRFGHLGGAAEVGVAEEACAVAAAEAHEYGGMAGPSAFALEGVENFVDFHRR